MPRRLLLIGLPTVMLLVVAAGIVWVNARGSVTRVNYNKIKIGMTFVEVESILGPPNADLPPMTFQDVHTDQSGLPAFSSQLRYWKNDSHMIFVIVASDGTIASKTFYRNPDMRWYRQFLEGLGI